MRKIFAIAVFAIILFYCYPANAKIRRVGYFGNPVTGTDYADLQSAHDSSNVNDTIMLFPGNWNANVGKKIVMLGYGYFITGAGANANLQNITGSLYVYVSLSAGADSSVYEGIDGLTVLLNDGETVNSVIVRRCNAFIYFNGKVLDNWHIVQSNINNMTSLYSGGKLTNLTVDNCYINSLNLLSGASDQSGQFNNDIISSDNNQEFGNGTFLIKNCIFLANHGADAKCIYQNSIANSAFSSIPAGNGNQNLDYFTMLDSVFVGNGTQGTYSNDGRWALRAQSPAKGAGANGTDCGIYGGSNPYKPSGIPRIPSFYKLSATSNTTSTNPYRIDFSVRSNN